MSKTLMELTSDHNALEQLLNDLNGDVSDEQVETTLQCWAEEITRDMAYKVDAYEAKIDFWQKAQELFNERAEKFKNAAKALKNREARLKDRLKTAMIQQNKFELIGNESFYRLTKSPPSMVIETNANIPTKYYTERITLELDKEQLKNDLKNGLKIDGVRLEYGFTLRPGVKK